VTRLHYLLILLAVLLITAYAGWVNNLFKPGSAQVEKVARHNPDYFMADINATMMDPQGRVRYRLQASRVSHYPDDNSLQLTRPDLHYFPPDGATWQLVSEAGRIYDDGERVYLDGAVNMQRPASQSTAPLNLSTRDLLVRPGEDYAETADRVVITSADSRLAGTGMRVYLDERRLELLANGEGTYVIGR
jgi:lipopolysaccharide export system protein LptC